MMLQGLSLATGVQSSAGVGGFWSTRFWPMRLILSRGITSGTATASNEMTSRTNGRSSRIAWILRACSSDETKTATGSQSCRM